MSRSLPVIVALVVCVSATAVDAGQRRGSTGRAGGSSRMAGPRAGSGGPSSPARPRDPGRLGVAVPRIGGFYRSYSYPYRYPYYGYYGGTYPYLGYGYPYGYYGPGWPFGYGHSYGYYGYPYGVPYDYWSYGYTVAGPRGSIDAGQGRVRIQGAPADAEVFADGSYVGLVKDVDVVYLEAGPHRIEIRIRDQPPIQFSVNIQPGRTLTYRAGRR